MGNCVLVQPDADGLWFRSEPDGSGGFQLASKTDIEVKNILNIGKIAYISIDSTSSSISVSETYNNFSSPVTATLSGDHYVITFPSIATSAFILEVNILGNVIEDIDNGSYWNYSIEYTKNNNFFTIIFKEDSHSTTIPGEAYIQIMVEMHEC